MVIPDGDDLCQHVDRPLVDPKEHHPCIEAVLILGAEEIDVREFKHR